MTMSAKYQDGASWSMAYSFIDCGFRMPLRKSEIRSLWKTAIIVHLMGACVGIIYLQVLLDSSPEQTSRFVPLLPVFLLGAIASLLVCWFYARCACGFGSAVRKVMIVLVLLCAAEVLAVGAYSYQTNRILLWWAGTDQYGPYLEVASESGNAEIVHRRGTGIENTSRHSNSIGLASWTDGPVFRGLGGKCFGRHATIRVSIWAIFVLLLVYPATAFVRDRKRFRRDLRLSAGLCTQCGYNLAGNQSGLCPECGLPCPNDRIS